MSISTAPNPDQPKTRMVIVGKNGQVATALRQLGGADDRVDIISIGRPEFDLEHSDDIARKIAKLRPDLVINTAAYTKVDDAESETDLNTLINATAAGEIAHGAMMAKAPIIHFSTDYVFDGTSTQPYLETDPVDPINAYGAAKLAGEHLVAKANPHHIILRTSWVYSATGSNFVRTMLRLAREREQLDIVSDQWGKPTSAAFLANACQTIWQRLDEPPPFRNWGIYHVAGNDICNWAQFAEQIFATSGAQGGPAARVNSIPGAQFKTMARRPAYSVLDTQKFVTTFDLAPPRLNEILTKTVSDILAQPDA